MNLRRLVMMRMLGIQSKKMVGVSLRSVVKEAWLEIGSCIIPDDVSWLLIGGGRVIRPPLREDVEMRLGLQMMSTRLTII